MKDKKILWVRKIWKNEDGNVTVMMCFALVVILAMSAFVIDIGMSYAEKEKLENGIDAAALAAVVELPGNRTKALEVANQYLGENSINTSDVVISVGLNGKSIEITAKKEVEHFFAKIFGKNSSEVTANNKIIIGPAASASGGIRPFAVQPGEYNFGQLTTLKEGGGDGTNGNYGVVALGGTGANVTKYNIQFGHDGELRVGDIIQTEPGNMTSLLSTVQTVINADLTPFENVSRDSERVWTLPVVDFAGASGRDEVEIIGFAKFYIEDIGIVSGQVSVKGRFMQYVAAGDIDENLADTGVYASKLILD